MFEATAVRFKADGSAGATFSRESFNALASAVVTVA